MKRALLILFLSVTALAVVAVLALSSANLQRLAESLLSAGLSREIRVDGALALDLGVPTRIIATSVRLANPDWAEEPFMATAERVEVAIDPWTVVGSGPLIVEELRVTRLVGQLISDDSGRANWDFGDEGTGGEDLEFLIRELDVRETALTFQLPNRNPVLIEVDSLEQQERPDGLLETRIDGRFNGRPVDASGRIGTFRNLLEGKNVEVMVDADIGGLWLHSAGTIDDLVAPRQPKLLIELAAPDADDVAAMLGLNRSLEGEIGLELEVKPEGDGIALEAAARWGLTRLEAKGHVADLQALDGIELSASGSGPNMREAMRAFEMDRAPALPFRFAGQVSRRGSRLQIGETTFTAGEFLFELEGDMRAFPSLEDATLAFDLTGRDLEAFTESFRLPPLSAGAYSAEGRLDRDEEGRDRFRFAAKTELGEATISGTLGKAPDYLGSRADIKASGSDLQRLGNVVGVPGLGEEPFELSGEMELVADGFRLIDEITLTAGESSLAVSGALGRKPLDRGTDLSWQISRVDLADLSAISGLTTPLPPRSVDATGRLKIEPTSIRLEDLEGTLGRVAFTLEGEIARTERLEGSDVRVTLRGPDLDQLNFLVANFDLPAGAFDVSGRIQRTDLGIRLSESKFELSDGRGRLGGELALPTDRLRLSYDVSLEGPDAARFGHPYLDLELPPAPFQVQAKGSVNDSSWRIEDSLVRIGANEAALDGEIQRNRPRGALRFRLDLPDVSEPGAWYGLDLPVIKLQLSGGLIREEDLWRLDNVVARSDKGEVAGNLAYIVASPNRVEADLTSSALDLSWLIAGLEERSVAAVEATRSDRVIPDWVLPMEKLRRMDAKLSVTADHLVLKDRTVENAYAELELEAGALRLEPVSFSGDEGNLEARFSLIPEANGTNMSLSMTARDLRTSLFRPNQDDIAALPRGNWYLALQSRGNTLRDLAANLNGHGKLESSSGRIANTRTQSLLLGAFFSSVFRAMNPFAEEEPYTDVVCAVFPFTISDGIMESTPSLVVQTEKLNMLSRGTIDLRTEQLDLTFRSQPRRGLGVSAGNVVNPLVRIGGTLAAPSVNLNRRGALVTGGAAVLTGGLSLLAQTAFGAAFRSSDPCGQALEESKKHFRKSGSD